MTNLHQAVRKLSKALRPVWAPLFAVLLLFGIAVESHRNWTQITQVYFEMPAFIPRMVIDSSNYIEAGRKLKESASPWYTEDHWHGVGMQLVVGMIFRLADTESAGSVKVFNWICWNILLVAWGLWGWRVMRSALWGLATAYAISLSASLQAFCATAQYEVVVSLVFVLILHLAIVPKTWAQATAGLLCGVIGVFRFHFASVALFLAAWNRPKKAVLLGFAAFSIVWNALYSLKAGQLLAFQGGFSKLVEMGLNMGSQGYVYPFEPIVPPTGLEMILREPGAYLALLGKRWMYLSGLSPDIWATDARFTLWVNGWSGMGMVAARAAYVICAGAMLSLGIISTLLNKVRDRALFLPLTILGPILLGTLIFNASDRYLVPALPSLIFFQMLGVRFVFDAWRRRFSGFC